jgi:oleate hydratase
VKDEILDFNLQHLAGGKTLDAGDLGLSVTDRIDLIVIMRAPEASLGVQRIESCFQPSFFKTHFWMMWRTTFAFQPGTARWRRS